jgi:hypothetical protein
MIIGKALLAFALAFLAESMVEYLLAMPLTFLIEWRPQAEKLKLKLYAALGVGIVMAFQYDLDLIFEAFGYTAHWVGFGVLLTGLGIGRGSNWLHDFWTTYLKPGDSM